MIDKKLLKEYFVKPLCFAAVIVIVLFLLNKFTYFNISLGSNNNNGSFEVIGVGTVTKVPNIAQTTFTIEEKGATQDAAKNAATVKQNEAQKTLEQIGIQKTDITTSGFNVNPNFENSPTTMMYPNRPTQQGYMATIITTVKSSQIDRINKAIDALTKLGINVGGVSYSYSDETTYQEEAQAKAIQNAKVQAENLAKAAGFKLGKIVTIRDADNANTFPQPYAAGVNMMKAAAPSAPTDLQPGANDITARMGVTYYIKN
ncbi:MAG: SIMPL domain-containing protein [Candidatus Levyibacteriota bacterium]